MLDEKSIRALFGAVVAAWAGTGEANFISAKDFYGAGLAAGLDLRTADPECRAPTLKTISSSFEQLSHDQRYRSLLSMAVGLMNRGGDWGQRTADILAWFRQLSQVQGLQLDPSCVSAHNYCFLLKLDTSIC
jgi:hypothetical protein